MQELLHPSDSVERQRDKLLNICSALMRRVEQAPSENSSAYAQFERAALLEAKVRERTAELEQALNLLNESNAQLAEANREIETARANLNEAIESVDEGFALFDDTETLVLFNSRFCRDLDDIIDHLAPGMSFTDYVQLVSRSRALDLPRDTAPADWLEQRLEHHSENSVVFNIALTDRRWMQVSEHRTQDGGTVIIQTDISAVMLAQHQAREQLVDSQSRMLRATLDHLAQGVCIFDKHGSLVGWNQKVEQMIRLPAPGGARVGLRFTRILDMLHRSFRFSDAGSRAWLRDWAERKGTRDPINFDLAGVSGQIFNVFAQEMPDQGFVISFTDVTKEHKAAEALRDLNRTLEQRVEERTEELGIALREAERANESKNRFVAAASHDLLQPLSAAKLYLETIQDMQVGDDAIDVSRKAASALHNAEEIIEALLDISKLDAGRATFNVRHFPLATTFDSIASEMAPAAARKGLALTVVPSSLTVVSDPVFFRRILQNLVSNAIRYTDAGRILVGVRRRGKDRAVVQVLDTGRGIRPEDQSRIFQEFARVDRPNSGADGIGLGLAIVERACASLEHGLALQSHPGLGSCFSVEVPVADGETADAGLAVTTGLVPDITQGMVLLLVENDPDVAQAMTLQFEGRGAHVLHASTAEAALDLLKEIDLVPDVVLLDHQLGAGMSGIELCQAIEQIYGPVPRIIVSASRSAELVAACARLSVPLLRKPFESEQFLRALADIRPRPR